MSGRILRLALATGLCAGASGCHHQVKPAPVIPPPTPVQVANAPVPATPPQLPTESAGQPPLPTAPALIPAPAPKKKKPAPAPAPVEVATATPPPPIPVGSLTAEGDLSTQSRQRAADLLGANDKRLAGLSADLKNREKDQIGRVANFQVDARKALDGGDIEAAMTLATKAKVLLDEISK
jgi:hypothetical protein